jgi:arginine N-succinyltransferase
MRHLHVVPTQPSLTPPHAAAAAAPGTETLAVVARAVDGQQQVLATLQLVPAVGLDLPRAAWHVGCAVHAAPELRLHHRQLTLLLGHDHTGASELAALAWQAGDLPQPTRVAALRLLVRAALLRLASQRSRFAPRLIAELPGVRDAQGRSPFWDGLGRHFYAGDPAEAAARHGPAWRSHVASLLPRQLVYASFLTPAAQAAIARADPASALLREVLEESGLRYGHHVAVDDAGPVLEAETDALPGVSQARPLRLQRADAPPAGAMPWLVMMPTAAGADDEPDQASGDGWRIARHRALLRGGTLLLAPDDEPAEAGAVDPAGGAAWPPRAWAVPL